MERVTALNIGKTIGENANKNSVFMITEFLSYKFLDSIGRNRYIVNYFSKQYAIGQGFIHTNINEGFSSLLRRGINNTFHYIGKVLLSLYLNEFNFRYKSRSISGVEKTRKAL